MKITAPDKYRWLYPSKIDRVVDADTLRLLIDHGCRVYSKQVIRLAGVNAAEMSTPEGRDAAARIREALNPDAAMIVQTISDRTDPYGRFLGIVFVDDGREAGAFLNLNAWLLAENLAVPMGPYAKIVGAMPLYQDIGRIAAIKEPA